LPAPAEPAEGQDTDPKERQRRRLGNGTEVDRTDCIVDGDVVTRGGPIQRDAVGRQTRAGKAIKRDLEEDGRCGEERPTITVCAW